MQTEVNLTTVRIEESKSNVPRPNNLATISVKTVTIHDTIDSNKINDTHQKK